VYDVTSIEERNKPAVAIVNQGFVNDARSAASSRGIPEVRVVGTSIPCESSVIQDIENGVTNAMDNIIAALTTPLSAEEKSPKPKQVEKLSRIIFKGDLEEINRFFYQRGWTDGLPVIPPTEDKVAAMLTGTDLSPDHVVTTLGPREGKATLEKIAINAVMAGALPTYMPLLIAGVKALIAYPEYGYLRYGVSTGSWAPFWIINGPIRNEIHLNSGTGALSPGDIANATIGRAMGLILKNIGGMRKGVEDMGTIGNPGKYSLVIAENEEESPWEPLHVEYGFKREDNTISFSMPNICVSGGWPYGSDDEGILRYLMYNIKGNGGCIILNPTHAKNLANLGWTKKAVKEFLVEYTRVPGYRLGKGMTALTSGLYGNKVPVRDVDDVPLIRNIEDLAIIVAGGPGAHIGQLMGGVRVVDGRFSCWGRTTTKVELPKNWKTLVEKYKSIMPLYARY
jgi:hypothetical protein